MTREWDAAAYECLSAPQTRWGRIVVDRLELDGNERVLDAGCGTGRVTAMLLERLPDGRVIGLDGSAAMIEHAGVRFAGEPRVELLVADLTEPLPLDGPVDAILSTATFHWIVDHGSLFHNLASVLRPGDSSSPNAGEPGTSRRSNGSSPSWVTRSEAGRRSRRRRRPERGWKLPASTASKRGSTTNRPRYPETTWKRSWRRCAWADRRRDGRLTSASAWSMRSLRVSAGRR